MTDITALIDLITKGGLVSTLIIALVGGMRGWYVWKHVHEAAVKAVQDNLNTLRQDKDKQIEDLIKDRDYWREQAVRCLTATGRIANVVEASKRPE